MNKLTQLVKRWRAEANSLRRLNLLLYRLPHPSKAATSANRKEAKFLTKYADELAKAMKKMSNYWINIRICTWHFIVSPEFIGFKRNWMHQYSKRWFQVHEFFGWPK